MADNYLERKMAEHVASQRGGGGASAPQQRASAPQQRAVSPQTRRGVLAVPFPPQRIAVTGCEAPVTDALLTMLRQTGSVAEYCPDAEALDALRKRLGALDTIINVTATDTVVVNTDAPKVVSSPNPEALARMAAVLCAPSLRPVTLTQDQ